MRFGLTELVLISCLVLLLLGPGIYNRVMLMRSRRRKKTTLAQRREQERLAQKAARDAKIKIICCSVLGAVLLFCVLYLAFWPLATPAQAYTLTSGQSVMSAALLDGENTALDGASTPIALSDVGVVLDLQYHNDWVYASVEGGEILRVRADGTGLTSLVNTGGEILSFTFDASDNIIFTDASYEGTASGVYCASFDGFAVTVEALVTQVGGTALSYPSGVAVASSGDIYFTNATEISALEHGTAAALRMDLLAHTASGAVYCYSPATGETSLVAQGIAFASSLCLSPNEEVLYVTAFADCSVLAVDVAARGITASETGCSVVLDGLPGYPAQIATASDGTVYVSLFLQTSAWRESLAQNTALRDVILRLPTATQVWFTQFTGEGFIFAFDDSGTVTACYQTEKSSAKLPVTALLPTEDGLYFSQLSGGSISLLALS